MVFNSEHASIEEKNVAKLDRIYLLSEYFNMKLGAELLKSAIEVARKNDQSGIWLFTWVGNIRAINFYLKAGFQIIGSHQFRVTASSYNMNHHMYLKLGTG
jgi:ribosomal protein S18 acetylase RimI-like enzyme